MENFKPKLFASSLFWENNKQSTKIKLANVKSNDFFPGFPHLAEQIFAHLANGSLRNCREVAKSCQECIDDRNLL